MLNIVNSRQMVSGNVLVFGTSSHFILFLRQVSGGPYLYRNFGDSDGYIVYFGVSILL